MTRAIAEQFTREMGLTFDDFLRTLPGALAPLEYSIEGRRIAIAHPEGSIEISLGETQTRRIASLVLPCTPVTFSFSGLEKEERRKFIDQFDLYFHRGGG
ncbi:MAG: hypothetical protein KDI63_13960 [Gammaproteobacteria bacterium]|nr:hypothetical protein [Gammaproteobacteria bacterium]